MLKDALDLSSTLVSGVCVYNYIVFVFLHKCHFKVCVVNLFIAKQL